MKLTRHLAMLSALLLVCTCTYTVTAQGCTAPTALTNAGGVGKTDGIPNIQADPGVLRPQVGGRFVEPWALLRSGQVFEHGLWCQVNSASNADMGSNIGDMFYPTGDGPDGFTVASASSTYTPFRQLKCTNQIGIVVTTTINNQGVVKCNTTIPNLDTNTNYWVVYMTSFFNSYTGPTVDSNMIFSILSPRDADPNIEYSLSFTVSYGPPSRVRCTRDSSELLNIRELDSRLTREVIRSRYISSTQPDMTRVTVRPGPQPRLGGTYNCTVFVEGRSNIASGDYEFVTKGSGSSTVTVTVAGIPTAVTVTRTTDTNVRVSWTAPSGPALGGYEVFYQTAAGSSGSNTTTTTELTLTGLVLGQTYSIFVVAFGPEGAPVLPSACSNTEMITLDNIQPTNVALTPSTTSIMVTWTAPESVTPVSYSVSVGCLRLCDIVPTIAGVLLVPNGGAATSYTISNLDPGVSCTVRVIAMVGSVSNVSDTAFTNTLTAAPTGAPETLNITSVEKRSLTAVWGTVPCPDQRGPITGYRLRYNSMMVNIDVVDNMQHMLTGLTPFTSYSVQVAAVNAGGTGPYSDPALTVETLQDVPGPVSDLSVNPGVVQLTISWSPPSEPNGPITMYQISYSTGVGFNTSATQHTLRDLIPNTVVVFSVRAYTIIGPGENVTMQASTTSVPVVTGVRVSALNSTAVNVSWTPVTLPETDYIITIHYTLVGRTKRQSSSGSVNVSAGSSSGVVSGLMTGEQYQFSVSITVPGNGRTYTGPVSDSSDPLTVVEPSSGGSEAIIAAVIIVVLLLFVAAMVMIVIVVVLLRRSRSVTSKSPHNSLAIYDIPDKQTSDDIKMAECAAYGTHQTQQKPSNDTGVYEQICTTT